MKKITFFAVLLCLCTCMRGNAQKSNIILSIEGAPSVRWLTGNKVLKEFNHPTLGFYGGVTAQIPLSARWSIVTGGGFEHKGSVAKFEVTDFNAAVIGKASVYNNLDYLTIPVLIRASFGNKIKYYFNAGCYYGGLWAANSTTDDPNNLRSHTKKEDNISIIQSSDFGLSIGGGVRVQLTPKWTIPIEIRSNHGVINTSKVPIVNNGSIKTNATNLIVGLSYEFGKP